MTDCGSASALVTFLEYVLRDLLHKADNACYTTQRIHSLEPLYPLYPAMEVMNSHVTRTEPVY
jgi:hypothetical protein